MCSYKSVCYYFFSFLLAVSPPKKPPPPENCTVTFQTRYYLRVKCQIPENLTNDANVYLMQVYHAHTRLLIGTATSQDPEDITINNLPQDYQELLLFIRTMDSRSVTSDASIIYVGKGNISGKR